MADRVRVAVIGAGRMGNFHARACANNPDVKLVGVVDADTARAAEVAAAHGSAPAMLEELAGKIDAAVVAVPTEAHLAIAEPLLRAGLACLIEKPLAMDSAECRRLVDAARQGGAVLQVGHVERFNPAFMALSPLGLTPRFIETERISPCRFRSMDVGVVMDLMIHDIDLVLSLVRSPVVSVDAVGVNIMGAVEDMANVRVRFENGCVADMTASRAALKVERRIRVYGSEGYVGVDFNAKRATFIKPGEKMRAMQADALCSGRFNNDLAQGVDYAELLDSRQIEINDHDALGEQLKHFVRAIRGQDAVTVSGQDGCDAVSLAEEIVRCIRAMG
jgi:predicted dehydrogenase